MALRHDEVEQVDRLTDTLLTGKAPSRDASVDVSRDGSVNVSRDRILVERCQAGDRQAFDEFYRRYQRRLYRFCMQRLGQVHDAEDVVQESFVRAWRALPRFAGERRFYPWLTVIAGNLCVDTLRRRSRLTPVEESRIIASDPGTYDTEDAVLHEVDSKMVATAFGHLSTRHQRVLQMREGSDWTYREIAEHEGVGVTAVETLLWRARQALKREFLILDEQRGKVGALIGFLVMLPARAVIRAPKAMKHGVGHAIDGTRNAIGALSTGAFSDFGSGALGVFGPSVAAATGAVAITVGTVLMLPATSGPTPSAGSATPAPVTTAVPALASPIVSKATGPTTGAAPVTTSTTAGSSGSSSGSSGSGGGPTAALASIPSPGPFGLGMFVGGFLNSVKAAGDGPGVVGNLGAAIGGPVGGAINSVGSAAKGLAGAVSPILNGVEGGLGVTGPDTGAAGSGTDAGAGAASGATGTGAATGTGTGTGGKGTTAGPNAGAGTSSSPGLSGPISSVNSAVNGLTKALGIPLNLGS